MSQSPDESAPRKMPRIHRAAAAGDVDGIRSELAKGTPVDLADPETGHTPLMKAASSHRAATVAVQLLLEHRANVNAIAGKDCPVLYFAIRAGNTQKVRMLLDAGADVRYVRPSGYDALIDAMYNDLSETERCSLLSLLIDRGAPLNGVSSYSESALSVASRTGQFQTIRLILAAGADPAPLRWTPLMCAIALGSLDDVKRELESGEDLSARDFWHRTPWLLSLQTKDLTKAQLPLTAGASSSDRGRCGMTPLMYPLPKDDADMLRWLLSLGLAVDDADEHGSTALHAAVENSAIACARLLLEAGADARNTQYDQPIIKSAGSVAMARLLVSYGADLNDMSDEVRSELTRLPHDGVVDVSRQTYVEQKLRRFGSANPERMNLEFWCAMVKSGAYAAIVRRYYNDSKSEHQGPVWCFQRFGKSLTELPDGRIIEIGGEHEDYYDPEFCIYNDVVVHHGDGAFDIFGYPRDCFPPTDFHTATLVGPWIYVIGGLGYPSDRQYGATQVFRLHTESLVIERVYTTGDSPGWLNRHKARLITDGQIHVSGGKVCGHADDRETYTDNVREFVLDLDRLTWNCCSAEERPVSGE